MDMFIEEKTLELDCKKIVDLTKSCLQSMTSLVIFILRIGEINIEKEDLNKLQNLVDTHKSLSLFEITKKNIFKQKTLRKRLTYYVKNLLRYEYDNEKVLNEVQVLFLGDGRVGKTSTIRSLFDKEFLLNNESTLLLNDIDIFGINPNSYKWTSISKYQLSIQRVKNSLPDYINLHFNQNTQVIPKYRFEFEKELLSRTVADKKFIEEMKINTGEFNTKEVYFRVYDFGGQEVFSSIHHIFMNSKSIYFLVFNMTKLSSIDIQRMKFWCESILRNALEAPIIFIGTCLRRYKRKNREDKNLKVMNENLVNFTKTLSSKLHLLENEQRIFFPIENSYGKNSKEITRIKEKASNIVSGRADINRQDFLNFKARTSWILFMDNCREENNFTTKKEFKEKAFLCGFEALLVEDMLQAYSKAGIISYFPDLNLPDSENLIFFAPSYLAQALGSFIRDKSFHELAFRISSEKFSLYRKYVDSGKLNKELFNILLRDYSQKERRYIFQLAIQTLVLIPVENIEDQYIHPELLPPVDNKLNAPLKRDVDFIFTSLILLSTFVQIVNIFQRQKNVTETLLYKGFCRIIFGTNYIIDIFVATDKVISFSLVQSLDLGFLSGHLENLIPVIRKTILTKFEMVTNKAINEVLQNESAEDSQVKKVTKNRKPKILKKFFSKIFQGKD
eukprot:snap_masked-scaffold_93-processed-gene-0.17-mRNA-1 protein AED:1.00 eAED:1.00 QI:0/0/0/0/1/1/3/0/673